MYVYTAYSVCVRLYLEIPCWVLLVYVEISELTTQVSHSKPNGVCTYLSEFYGIFWCLLGVLLRRLQDPRCLSTISHIILDEVHERGVRTANIVPLIYACTVTHTNVDKFIFCALHIIMFFA